MQFILPSFSHGGPYAMIFFISCYYHLFSAWNRLKIRQRSGMVREVLHLICDHVRIVSSSWLYKCSLWGSLSRLLPLIPEGHLLFSLTFILFVFHMTHLHWLSFLKCTWLNYLPLFALPFATPFSDCRLIAAWHLGLLLVHRYRKWPRLLPWCRWLRSVWDRK